MCLFEFHLRKPNIKFPNVCTFVSLFCCSVITCLSKTSMVNHFNLVLCPCRPPKGKNRTKTNSHIECEFHLSSAACIFVQHEDCSRRLLSWWAGQDIWDNWLSGEEGRSESGPVTLLWRLSSSAKWRRLEVHGSTGQVQNDADLLQVSYVLFALFSVIFVWNLANIYWSNCRYYSGEKKAPILTIFVGGNHEASNHLQELPYGGWVAPNIYYLGRFQLIIDLIFF